MNDDKLFMYIMGLFSGLAICGGLLWVEESLIESKKELNDVILQQIRESKERRERHG